MCWFGRYPPVTLGDDAFRSPFPDQGNLLLAPLDLEPAAVIPRREGETAHLTDKVMCGTKRVKAGAPASDPGPAKRCE